MKNVKGYPWAACHAATSRSNGLTATLLPIRLSSTMKAMNMCCLRIASSSAITWALVFSRGWRPNVTMMSQNSHWNGQPRLN